MPLIARIWGYCGGAEAKAASLSSNKFFFGSKEINFSVMISAFDPVAINKEVMG